MTSTTRPIGYRRDPMGEADIHVSRSNDGRAGRAKRCSAVQRCHRSVIALGTLPVGFASAADGSGVFACALFRRLLVVPSKLHLAVNAFALQLLFQCAEGLVDVIVANDDLHTNWALGYPGGRSNALPYDRPGRKPRLECIHRPAIVASAGHAGSSQRLDTRVQCSIIARPSIRSCSE